MKLLLCLCIVSSVIATFDAANCLKAFLTVNTEVLNLKQRDLKEICLDKDQVNEKIKIIKKVLPECGLDDWRNPSNNQERKIGAVVSGLLGYVEKLLCLQREDHYCFPAASKIVDVPYLVELFADFDVEKFDLKCSVMSRKETIRAICPGGPIGSGKRQCQESMVKYFEIAVRTIRAMLKGLGRNKVTEEVMPLLNLAIDVKEMCHEGPRRAARRLVKHTCSGTPPTDEPDYPTCLKEQPITNECLREEICKTYDDKPVCNKIEKFTLSVLAANKAYKGLLNPTFSLRDGSDLTLEKAKNICCGSACQAARASGNKCGEKKKHQTHIEIAFPGKDLVKEFNGLTDEQKKELKDACCLDQQVKRGSFDIEDCHVEFKEGHKKQTERRLFEETTTIIATVTVNSSDETPFSCENGGSFYAFDTALETNGNINTTGGVIQQTSCNCTGSMCAPVNEDEAGASPTEGGPDESNTDTDDSGAMQLSISLAAMLFCVLFAINGSNM